VRLKNIKLAGFKSFVDPTTVPLNSPLVAIVGPNGCGKSNIIDAVRWVMGESSAKQLRGESMADVIFNGSSARKPVGQASIELTFDNSDASLGGAYASYAEISIRRQVTRDGQSNYYLNGSKCRRRDITDIFLGTGLGPRSYAIIEQGTISRLIEAKPEELRVYLEEAAGISKYKERRRETESRIEHTRENLARLSDVREELGKQLDHLQRQAKSAERYKLLKQEERSLKAQLLALRWKTLDAQVNQQETQITERETQLEAQIAKQRALEADRERLHESQQEASETFNAVQTRYYRMGAEITRLEQALLHHRERRTQLQTDSAETERTWQETQQHLSEDQTLFETLSLEMTTLGPDAERTKIEAEQAAQALQQAEQEMRGWQVDWDAFNQQAGTMTQQAQVEQTRIQHLEQHYQNVQQKLERLQQEASQLDATALETEIQGLQQQLSALVEQQTTLQQNVDALQNQLSNAQKDQQTRNHQLDTERNQLQSLRGRYASFEALQQAALGQRSGAIVDWLTQHQLADVPRLGQTLKVTDGWETAVETVLGDYLEAVCVPSIDNVTGLLSSLDKGTLCVLDTGSATSAFPLSSSGVALSSHVKSSYSLQNLLAGIYAADNLDDALKLAKTLAPHESVITQEGVWLGNGWLRVTRDSDTKTGMLRRAREMEELEQTIETTQAAVESHQQAIEEGSGLIRQLESTRDDYHRQRTEQGTAHADVRVKIQAKQGQADQIHQRAARIATEIQEQSQHMERDQAELTAARAVWRDALEKMEQQATQRDQWLQTREQLTQQLDTLRQQAHTHRDQAHQLALRLQTATTQITSIEQNRQRLEKQLASIQERRAHLIEAIKEVESPVAGLTQELEQGLKERAVVEVELTTAQQQLQALEHEFREVEKQRGVAETETSQARTMLEQRRMDWQGSQVRRNTLLEQIAETEYELQTLLIELEIIGFSEATEDNWQEKVQQVTGKIDRLGPINLAAIDEYTEQAERKTYLDAQHDDLTEALNTLEDAIRKIDRETRARFQETYDQVNERFQALFPRIFGGGRAYLELTGDDLLSTGIALMAQPPGKRNSSIYLLSGGEKALTALALVFSIFQLNPAPFCMLDEVDAPLDDANVNRFCELVKEMSKGVQFIFITHSKITMEMANQLIGVTMHEPGASRLVAVDIDEALALVEVA
jgi:chromosome segregation protein